MTTSTTYNRAFWNVMKGKEENNQNLSEGFDNVGAYVAPDEFREGFNTALAKENIFRRFATVINLSSAEGKIQAVSSTGTADWVEDGDPIPESADTFTQFLVKSYKLASLVKLNRSFVTDMNFNLEKYLMGDFAKRFGKAEENALLNGNGTTQPTGILTARRKQYEYYRDFLLTFDEDVPKVRLDKVTTITRGVRVVKSQLTETGTYPVFQNSMTPLGYYEKSNFNKNTVFIIGAGAAGEIGYSKIDFWAADDCYCLTCSDRLQSRFLYYAILCQKSYLLSRVRRASVPRLARSVIERVEIPVPPLKEQERIVSILDRFDALCNDLTSGIPAEIEARQKQYEYYRDKLLSFKEVTA
jgi:hypothetical protein